MISKITTGNRRFINKVKKSKPNFTELYTGPCPTEIDNHADTICFGRNFRPIYFTSEVCSVSPFLSEYDEESDIQICTAATAYNTADGETIILTFGQGLWFGERMERSLINPNQCRHFGISICDDPMDPYRQLGIEINEDYFIPLNMVGTTCAFSTRCPTITELESCKTFYLSDEQHWDPHNVTFDTGNGEKLHKVSAVDSKRNGIHDDTDMESTLGQISSIYNSTPFCHRLIASINVSATYSSQ